MLAVFVTTVAFLGARMIKNPPEGYICPQVQRQSKTTGHSSTQIVKDIPPRQFIKTRAFYILWLALAMVIGGGFTAIGLIPAYGEIKLGLEPAIAALAISAYALTNGLGQPLIGNLSDNFGTLRIMSIVYCVQATVFFVFPFLAIKFWILILFSLFLGIGYATTFALFPVLVAAGFGTKYLDINYGLVFSAFGVGALTSLIGSKLLDVTNSFAPAFMFAGATTLFGLILILFLHRDMEKDNSKK